MSVADAELVVMTMELHLVVGAVFAAVFLGKWVGILDPAARQGTVGFRLLVFPGVAMLWPLFVLRLAQRGTVPAEEWTAHRAPRRQLDRKTEVLK
jgi:hypothetical protein